MHAWKSNLTALIVKYGCYIFFNPAAICDIDYMDIYKNMTHEPKIPLLENSKLNMMHPWQDENAKRYLTKFVVKLVEDTILSTIWDKLWSFEWGRIFKSCCANYNNQNI